MTEDLDQSVEAISASHMHRHAAGFFNNQDAIGVIAMHDANRISGHRRLMSMNGVCDSVSILELCVWRCDIVIQANRTDFDCVFLRRQSVLDVDPQSILHT